MDRKREEKRKRRKGEEKKEDGMGINMKRMVGRRRDWKKDD